MHDEDVPAVVRDAIRAAEAAPGDVARQIEAAYSCDRHGTEEDAVG